MTTTDLSHVAATQHVATLLDDLITWRTVGQRPAGKRLQNPDKGVFTFGKSLLDARGTSNIQPHGGAWMPTDRSFDRILFW